jgi:hypothetical protein
MRGLLSSYTIWPAGHYFSVHVRGLLSSYTIWPAGPQELTADVQIRYCPCIRQDCALVAVVHYRSKYIDGHKMCHRQCWIQKMMHLAEFLEHSFDTFLLTLAACSENLPAVQLCMILDHFHWPLILAAYCLNALLPCKGKGKVIRYRPGVAQRVGRGIALLFRDCSTRMGWVVSSTSQARFAPGKDPVSIVQEAGWTPGPVWTGRKFHPHQDSIPDCPARSSVTILTELPGPLLLQCSCDKLRCGRYLRSMDGMEWVWAW